ncbi:hypothetical protein [Desulfonema magnum]|uniref:Uncharacterized protein n=1 Tax=Desulfonema magnum TaxID=45655 RepID=A0A975BVY9_9BACT|nr:hypothetical protein [Desulfonema magnum]QTA92377.1 Uncharacterized protein dnm_084560 [Desulfonema magnum]
MDIEKKEKEKEQPSSFKFNVDDDERPESLFQARKEHVWRENRRVETLSRRITLIFILIFFLIGITGGFAYLEIEKRFAKIHSSESTEVQKLSQHFESRFSLLSAQYGEFEALLTKKVSSLEEVLATLEDTTTSLKNDLRKTEAGINKIRAFEINKKEWEGIIGKISSIEKMIEPVRKELDGLKSADMTPEIKVIEEKFTEELAKLSETMKNPEEEISTLREKVAAIEETITHPDEAISKLQEELTSLAEAANTQEEEIRKLEERISASSPGKIDKEAMDTAIEEHKDVIYLALQNHKEIYQQKLDSINKNLKNKEDKIKAVQKQLKELEKILKSVPQKNSLPATKPLKPPVGPLPEDIIEQDIR